MNVLYTQLTEEIVRILEISQSIVLATAFDNKVTTRTMSHVNDGLIIMFQTEGNSEKAQQIRQNTRIAFAVSNMQIEAIAEINGHPNESPMFIEKYKAKFPGYYEKYTNIPDEILITAVPVKITLYKYIDGKPCKDILLVNEEKAYREW